MAENYPALLQDVWDTGRQKPFDWILRNPRAAARVEQYCLPHADHIVVVVEESAARLEGMGVSPNRLSIVSNTPSLARLKPDRNTSPRSPEAPLELVYMGLMELARGVSLLLDAVSRLEHGGRTVHANLIGGGRDLGVLREHASGLGLGDSVVTFHGYVPDHRTALNIVGAADVGVIPHHANEWATTTIPNKLFDYMAAGLPVVSSSAAPCKRILLETGAGLVFEDRNADSLADAIGSLRNEGVRRRYGEAGLAAVRQRYNWETDSGTLLRAVDQLLLTGKAGG
jgi:glycosyltransferase involved in cell wall biosynthesis